MVSFYTYPSMQILKNIRERLFRKLDHAANVLVVFEKDWCQVSFNKQIDFRIGKRRRKFLYQRRDEEEISQSVVWPAEQDPFYITG